MVADMVGVEGVQEAERAVVDGQAQDRHIVRVHHAVAEARRPASAPPCPRCAARPRAAAPGRVAAGVAAGGVEAVDDEIGQLAQRGMVLARGEVLEMAEADKARRQARDHGGGLDGLAAHRGVRADDGQRPRRRHAQRVHGLGAQVFADRRAQHRAAIGHARVGRQAAPSSWISTGRRRARPRRGGWRGHRPVASAQTPNWWPE